MFETLFQKKKYLDCPLMKSSLHFFYNQVRACCTNVPGPIFYDDFKGGYIDWDYIYQERKEFFKKIIKKRDKNYIPYECRGCCDLDRFMSEQKPNDFENVIEKVYFHNHMSCNAKCTYCTYEYYDHGYGYDVVSYIKELIDKKILSPNALIYMSGGEITIAKEFEELLSLLLKYLNSKIEILTSGIKYCESIKQAFIENKCRLVISLDSGTKETYKKIKQVDAFEKVKDNISNYIMASDYAKEAIMLKYIIVDGINDNKEEINNFINLCSMLGIINVRLDFDYEKYKFTSEKSVPPYYFELFEYFNKTALEKNLTVSKCEQIEAILDKSRK